GTFDPPLERKVAAHERPLPARMDRHDELRACKLGEVVLAAEGGDQQDGVVPALAVDRVRALGDRETGLADIGFGYASLIILSDFAEVIVQASDHEDGEAFA